MTHAGNIIGYGFGETHVFFDIVRHSRSATLLGFLPLAQIPLLNLLGGSQFRKFCVVVMIILVVTVAITCISQDEKQRPADVREHKQRYINFGTKAIPQCTELDASKLVDVLKNIWNALVHLPKPIRRVCYVQFFAFMGWFPFLFYA